MTPLEARKLWADALRSGDYKQTKFHLHVPNVGYCCLGVACEVYQKHVGGLEVVPRITSFDTDETVTSFNGTTTRLPCQVAEWLDIKHSGQLSNKIKDTSDDWEYNDSLARKNDNDGLTFEQIADLIEGGTLLSLQDEEVGIYG